ncbi:2-methylcitrate dehydratase [Oscillospiraceae bacterium]|nr:2-methylcitrate dehydratase [Oscillospiraceae bacterium]BDF73261.1 2-methylcitrate dehydratase [Oscillospiraceae bacterium]
MTHYTQGLADFLAGLRYEDLPAEVVDRAKKLTMHTVGATLAAKHMPCAARARAAALDTMGRGGPRLATVWGQPGKAPVMGAVFVNCTGADTLDWEDCSWTGHPTAGFIPVSLSMAEAMNRSGRDYLTAAVGGFEVYQRIAGYIQPPQDWNLGKQGWGLATWQIFAASMPAGKLLGCSPEQLNQLIGATGCATTVVETIIHRQMSDFYHLQFGFTGMNGAVLAGMARRDELDNLQNILDVEGGYAYMMRGFENDGWLDRNLGDEFLFNEILFKYWPANMWVQTPLCCLDAMRAEHGFTAEEISSIGVTPGFQARDAFRPEGYHSCKEAQFSIPYCLAAYLLCGRPGPGWFSADKLSDPAVLELASRVHLDREEVWGLRKCFNTFMEGSFPRVDMTVTLKSGAVLRRQMQFPKGHPRNPFGWEDCERTFRIGAEIAGLGAEKTRRFIALCRDLEHLENMAELAQCLECGR